VWCGLVVVCCFFQHGLSGVVDDLLVFGRLCVLHIRGVLHVLA
jgi:hypothetical protein